MDQFLERLRAETNEKNICEIVEQAPFQVLSSFTANGQDPLGLLDPKLYVIAHTAILKARFSLDKSSLLRYTNELHNISGFIERRHLGDKSFMNLVTCLSGLAEIKEGDAYTSADVIITFVRQCIVKCGVEKELTQLHQVFLKCALLLMRYTEDEIIQVSGIATKQVLDVLLFFYYRGLLNVAHQQFGKAVDSFAACVSVPTGPKVSAIQLEAFKKYALCSCIEYGKVVPLPQYTSHSVLGAVKSQCQLFYQLTLDTLYLRENRELLSSFGNEGLVRKVEEAQLCFSLLRLSRTFSRISLAEIAQDELKIPLEKVIELLRRLNAEEKINAVVDESAGIVEFKQVQIDPYQATTLLESSISKLELLNEVLVKADRGLSLTREIIQRQKDEMFRAEDEIMAAEEEKMR